MSWEFFNAAGFLKTNSGRELVSTLPSSPVDGQEVFFQASGTMATNGIIWHLRYDAASSSSYKWEFVGGADLYSQADGTERTKSVAASTWSDIHSTDPAVTVPLAGEYLISHRARMSVATGSATFYIGVKVGATEANVTDVTSTSFYEALATAGVSPFAQGVRTITAASTTVTQRYWQNSGTVNFSRASCNLNITPIRVG